MIERATFKNFKALRDVTIDFERFTVIVGPNGSGKTSILQGIERVCRLGTSSPIQLFSGEWAPYRLAGPNTENLNFELHWLVGDVTAAVGLSLGLQRDREGTTWSYSIRGQYGSNDFSRGPCLFRREPDNDQTKHVGFLNSEGHGLRKLPSFAFLKFNPRSLAEPAKSEDQVPVLECDGKGLAEVLTHMKLKHESDFDLVESSLREVVPSVRQIKLDRAKVLQPDVTTGSKEAIGTVVELDIEGNPNTPSYAISEGTLLALGLLTVILSPHRPTLILLDDIERGLHPKAIGDLVKVLRSLMQQRPELQIVTTTHSPYLIDQCDAKEVRLTTTKEDGSVVCGKLTDHPDYERWKDDMLPGEFWSMVGEDWIKDREKANAQP